MTSFFSNSETCANDIINHVGKKIVIGVPLGLGKPVGLLNALFKIALNDPEIQLTIITGLTLARPLFKNKLEKQMVEPILDRLLGNYVDPLYEKYRELQTLPKNIRVIEFFLSPGKFLYNDYVQQNYINSSYKNVIRDVIGFSINVLAQQVAPAKNNSRLYSLSCNTDLFHDMQQYLNKIQSQGEKIAIVAETNSNLPFMMGSTAEVPSDLFSAVIENNHPPDLFPLPKEELSVQDHFIGLYSSCLIKDDGCLQIGIGKLSNALANALILRNEHNDIYREILDKLHVLNKFSSTTEKVGDLSEFKKGLYASTEMMSDEYLYLFNKNILKKRVYDHIGLQTLLNSAEITESITPEFLNTLFSKKLINEKLSQNDFEFLQHFGIIKADFIFKNGNLTNSHGEIIQANLSIPSNKEKFIKLCLGQHLQNGKIIHAGFFLGSSELYSQLNNFSVEELQQFEMSSIARTNALSWNPELLTLQRKNSRFVNSSLMVTLLGVIISDGIKDYQEISGVGGQYDFVSMASELPDARSIIFCRSTRQSKNGYESNIVWDYTNSTISRYLRDIVITEYGIANCRGKTDSEVIKEILNVADSRFQPELLKSAKKAGKIEKDYQIPKIFQNNFPQTLDEIIKIHRFHTLLLPYPFGSDLTKEEEVLAEAFKYLKNLSKTQVFFLIIKSLFTFESDKPFNIYLQRMKLAKPKNLSDFIYKKILKYVIHSQQLNEDHIKCAP